METMDVTPQNMKGKVLLYSTVTVEDAVATAFGQSDINTLRKQRGFQVLTLVDEDQTEAQQGYYVANIRAQLDGKRVDFRLMLLNGSSHT